MTDTPRTIAEFNRITSQLDGAEDNLAYALSQMSGLACTLERELVAAQAENERLRDELKEDAGVIAVWRGRTERAESENERLREALEKIATVNAMDYEYVRWAIAALRREDKT